MNDDSLQDFSEPDFDPLAETVVRLPCFEPNSHEIELTGRDLCRNTMFVGTVGCGKTTVMNVILANVVAHHADDPVRKPGLLVFDFKSDGTTETVQHLAMLAGRADDVVVVDGAGGRGLDPLAWVSELEDLDAVTEVFLSLNPQWSRDNPYWESAARKRIDHALTIYALTAAGGLSMAEFLETFATIFLRPPADAYRRLVQEFGEVARSLEADANPVLTAKLRSVEDGLNEWEDLDQRTKSNETSTLTNYFAPLLSSRALGYFSAAGASSVDFQDIIDRGAIVVMRANAARDPAPASTVGRLAKAMFYRVAQSRQPVHGSLDRLVGLFADEFPLIVSAGSGPFSDVEQLQTLRSRRCFVVASTQGFASLDRKIGAAERMALQINFNTWFFMNSHEPAVESFAIARLGVRKSKNPAWSDGWAGWCELVCPPGALAQLGVGDAFVSLPDGRRYARVLNLARIFAPAAAMLRAPTRGTPLANLRAARPRRVSDSPAIAAERGEPPQPARALSGPIGPGPIHPAPIRLYAIAGKTATKGAG